MRLDDLITADAYLVGTQLSYRAAETRNTPPTLHRIEQQHGEFGHQPELVMKWADERIKAAFTRDVIPDMTTRFDRQIRRTPSDAFLVVAQLLHRADPDVAPPDLRALSDRYGQFGSRGGDFIIAWTDQRIREAGTNYAAGRWK